MYEKLAHDLAQFVANLFWALLPGALGALVAQSWERGLSWVERAVAIIAGMIISYYVKQLILYFFGLDPFVGDSIGFLAGLVAFKAAPGFQRSAAGAIADLPAYLRDRIFSRKGTRE